MKVKLCNFCYRPQNKLVTSGILGATPVKEKGRYCETDHAHQWSLKPRRHYNIEFFMQTGVFEFQWELSGTSQLWDIISDEICRMKEIT